MTCCVLGDQDAILRHVASRGDRTSPTPEYKPSTSEVSTRDHLSFPRNYRPLIWNEVDRTRTSSSGRNLAVHRK